MKDDKKAANEAENKSAESATAETTENKTDNNEAKKFEVIS